MGADMILSIAAAPDLTKKAGKYVAQWAIDHGREQQGPTLEASVWQTVGMMRIAGMTFSPNDLMRFADEWVGPDDDDGPDDVDALSLELRRQTQQAVRDYMDRSHRDSTHLTLRGRTYIVSGGMSWGDQPTEACDWIDMLDRLSVWDKKITEDETRIALLHGLAECGTCHVEFPDMYPAARCPLEYEHPSTEESDDEHA